MGRSATSPEPGWLGAADDATAIVEPGRGAVSYRELDRLAGQVAGRLGALGIRRGDRVGLCLRRSADAIALLLGTLRAGAAYVPVDPAAPARRNAEILGDCGVRLTVIEDRLAAAYRGALGSLDRPAEPIEVIDEVGAGRAVARWTRGDAGDPPAPSMSPRDTAVILYTSGSTGRPKGWPMPREALSVHAAWARDYLGVSRADVFANHAQFNFGMSLFDVFASLGAGARLVLVPDEIRLLAGRIVELWSRERVTIWFSAPAILALVAETPGLEDHDLAALRVVAFAGERFPAPRLERLRSRLVGPRFFNFYGATELNVAAAHELPRDRRYDEPPPIGNPCPHYEVRVVAEDGSLLPRGGPGELQLRGPGLAQGYLAGDGTGAPPFAAATDGGGPWYRSGDLVAVAEGGGLLFAGRLGRMVKLRGYRVEPGEIEVRLAGHPAIREAAVVAVEGPGGLRLVAHVVGERMPVVPLKLYCAETLPTYMVPERFVFHERLPRNPRGKVDFDALRALGDGDGAPVDRPA